MGKYSSDSEKQPNFTQIPNSERRPLDNARKAGPVNPDEKMMVTLLVRRPSVKEALKNNLKQPVRLTGILAVKHLRKRMVQIKRTWKK